MTEAAVEQVVTSTRLDGTTAVVTGGGTGIGRGIALELARAGAQVVVSHLTHDAADLVAENEERGGVAASVRADLVDPAGAAAFIEEAAGLLAGRIDVLVNNAGGLVRRHEVDGMPDEHWDHVLHLNLTSAFRCTRSVLPHMRRGGAIINITSLAAQSGGGDGAVAYATAKAGMEGFTRSLAKELGPRGITVNAIAPGLILDTPFHATFTPEESQRAAIASTPMRRAGYPSDVAGAVRYLASADAAFVTGAVIPVNGGSYFR